MAIIYSICKDINTAQYINLQTIDKA